MGLNERFGEDLRSAMKSGDRPLAGALRLLRTRLKEAKVEKRRELSDEEIYRIIMSEISKRKEAIALFEKGGRKDLSDREQQEIEILEGYLPPKLTDGELRTHAAEAVKEVEAKDPRDLGKVMKVLMPKVAGRAEGSLVNKIVRELLAEQES